MTKKFRNITLSICITILAILLGFFGATFVSASAEETTVPTEDNYNFSGYTEYNRVWEGADLSDAWLKVPADSDIKVVFSSGSVEFSEGNKTTATVNFYNLTDDTEETASWEFTRVDAVDSSYYWAYIDSSVLSGFETDCIVSVIEKDGALSSPGDYSFKTKKVFEKDASEKFESYVDGVLSEGVDLNDTWVFVEKEFEDYYYINLSFDGFSIREEAGLGTVILDADGNEIGYYSAEKVESNFGGQWLYLSLEEVTECVVNEGNELPEGATLVLVGEHTGTYKYYSTEQPGEDNEDNLTGTGGSSINNNKTNKAESSLEWYEKVVLVALSVLELVGLCVSVIKAPGIKGKVIAVVVWLVLFALVDIPFVLYFLG